MVWCVQISGVVYMFRFPPQTALAVGLSMAQIGEFAFVLLSVASQLGLMPYQVYMLLMGQWPPLPLVSLSCCSRLSIGVTVMLQPPFLGCQCHVATDLPLVSVSCCNCPSSGVIVMLQPPFQWCHCHTATALAHSMGRSIKAMGFSADTEWLLILMLLVL